MLSLEVSQGFRFQVQLSFDSQSVESAAPQSANLTSNFSPFEVTIGRCSTDFLNLALPKPSP